MVSSTPPTILVTLEKRACCRRWGVDRWDVSSLRQNRLTMRFDYLSGDRLVARGEQQIACLGRAGEGLVPVPVPEELRAALEPYEVPA